MAYEAVVFTKQRPDRATLEKLVSIFEGPVEDLVRKDSKFKKLELVPEDYVGNPRAVVDILEKHIALLQRPTIVRGDRAIVGRPRTSVPAFFS